MRDAHRKRLQRDASRQRPPAPPNRQSFFSPVVRRVLVSMTVFLLAAPVIFAANGPNSSPNHNARAASVASTILPPTQKSGRAPPAARKLSTFGCPSTCEGFTCDYWVDGGGGYSCASLESEHGCDCVGCACAGESPVPSVAPTATTLPTSSHAPTPAPSSPRPTPAPTVCVDTAEGATNSAGSGCSDYDAYPGRCGLFDDRDFSSANMCCECGGGLKANAPTSSPTVSLRPTPAPTICVNTDDGDTDPYGPQLIVISDETVVLLN